MFRLSREERPVRPCDPAASRRERRFQRGRPASARSLPLPSGRTGRRLVRRQRGLILREWRRASDDADVPVEQLHANSTSDALLDARDERVERIPRGSEPSTVVHQIGVHVGDDVGRSREIAARDEALEITVRRMQHRSRRRFIDLACLDPDNSVLDHVDPADAMVASDRRQRVHELDERHRDAVYRDGNALGESHLDVQRVHRRTRRARESARRSRPAPPARDRQAHRTEPTGPRDSCRCCCTGSVAPVMAMPRARAKEVPRRGSSPITRRCETSARDQRADRKLESHLVVALRGPAVRDRGCTLHPRDFHEAAGDERACQGGRERIVPLVERSSLQRRQDVPPRELVRQSSTWQRAAPAPRARARTCSSSLP